MMSYTWKPSQKLSGKETAQLWRHQNQVLVCCFYVFDFDFEQFSYAGVYSEPFQRSKMEIFAETVYGKNSTLDVWHGSEYASNYIPTGNFSIHFLSLVSFYTL